MRLDGLKGTWSVAQSPSEASQDPQVLANAYLTDVAAAAPGRLPVATNPVRFDGRMPQLSRPPEHAEHTEQVLLELGYEWDDIVRLKESGVVT